jgi:excisionase family DNA binding protein
MLLHTQLENMDELLTAKQVQDLLKVDRTTIYRMLNDGRLTGVKVGHQWRFSSQDVKALLAGDQPLANASTEAISASLLTVLPLHCIQPVQNVFAEIANIGSVTTAPNGEPLTKISNSCQFCNLILASESGRKACVASWRKLGEQSAAQPEFSTCHAGLQYARARIEINGELAAMLIAGQFYTSEAERETARKQLLSLAKAHGIDADLLNTAVQDIQILDARSREKLSYWLRSVAHTFEDIGGERAELMSRLQRIAEMSTLEHA